MKPIDMNTQKLSLREIVGYSASGFGQNIICGLIGAYILIFYTDVFGISAYAAAVIMFAARIFDALNDPIMGSIVDKTRTRWGKLRPYLLFTPLPIGILTILCFSSPDLSESGKVAYAAVFYVLWGVVFTIIDVPYWGLSSAMTYDTNERSKLLTVARLACSAGGGLLTLVVPQITAAVTNKVQQGFTAAELETPAYNAALQAALQPTYFWIAVVSAIVGAPLFLMAFFHTRERVVQTENPPTLKHNLSLLLKNKPLLLIVFSCVLGSLQAVYGSMFLYLSKYTLSEYTGATDSWATIMSILAAPMGLVGSLIIPILGRKFTKKSIYIWSKLFGGVLLLVMYFIGYDTKTKVFVLAAGLLLLGLPSGINNVLTYAMIGDTVDYLELKTGERGEGICFSMQTFISKMTMAFCALAVGLCLGVVAYDANTYTPSPGVKNGLFSLATLGAAISTFASVIPILFYTFTEDKQKQAREVIEARKSE